VCVCVCNKDEYVDLQNWYCAFDISCVHCVSLDVYILLFQIVKKCSVESAKEFRELCDIEGLAHHKFILPGQSVTGHFHVQVLQRLCEDVRRKWHTKW
jgi:hypothetical protein